MPTFELFKKKRVPKNLKEVLAQFEVLKTDFGELLKEVKILRKENNLSIKRVGVVRFNPFKEIGGNQSFSIALLDTNNDGLVITSFYGREGNRVYAKPVKKGKSKYLLSKEEKKAIEKAQEIDSPNQKKNDKKK